jgi:hypothetical protein
MMKAGRYDLRMYRPEDAGRVIDLLGDVYGEVTKETAGKTWHWKYESNPAAPPGGPRMFVVECGGRIVGFLGTLAGRVKIRDSVLPLMWTVDWAVHPKHRGCGVRMFRYSLEVLKDVVHLGAALPRSYALARKLGALDACTPTTFTRLLHPYNALRARPIRTDLVLLFTGLSKLASVGLALVRDRPCTRHVKVNPISQLDGRFDALWERASTGYDVITVRDAAFLNWRFVECPHKTYKIFAAQKDEEVSGYVVFRMAESNGSRCAQIVDFLVCRDDRDSLVCLLAAVTEYAESQEADTVRCLISQDQTTYQGVLKRNGFLFRRDRVKMLLNPGSPEVDYMLNSRNWFLTYGDSDVEMS